MTGDEIFSSDLIEAVLAFRTFIMLDPPVDGYWTPLQTWGRETGELYNGRHDQQIGQYSSVKWKIVAIRLGAGEMLNRPSLFLRNLT